MTIWTRFSARIRASGALLGLMLLLSIYCLPALTADFFGGHDLASNLLPTLHYQRAILLERQLPWTTDLWYGGRAQWQNPLWNFFYLPATLLWLALPLRSGTTIIVVGHLLAGWAAVRLAALFVRTQIDRLLIALLFLSPIMVRLRYGHLEKLLAWPWVLLGLTFLLDIRRDPDRRDCLLSGACAGLCLGIIPLTGANYYALYSAPLFGALALGRSRRFLLAFLTGASIGLLHLPSVAYLADVPRQFEPSSIEWYRVSLSEAAQALFVAPPEGPASAESFAILGLGFALLLLIALWQPMSSLQWRLLTVLALELLLATALIYAWMPWLSTFRVPSRAMAFVALTLLLFVTLAWQQLVDRGVGWRLVWRICLILTCLQAVWIWRSVQPQGSAVWLDDGATELAQRLSTLGAESVWFSQKNPEDALIPIALTRQGIALPNVYYGQMGQVIPVAGRSCGYSFDYLITHERLWPDGLFRLHSDTYPRQELGSVPAEAAEWVDALIINGRTLHLFALVC